MVLHRSLLNVFFLSTPLTIKKRKSFIRLWYNAIRWNWIYGWKEGIKVVQHHDILIQLLNTYLLFTTWIVCLCFWMDLLIFWKWLVFWQLFIQEANYSIFFFFKIFLRWICGSLKKNSFFFHLSVNCLASFEFWYFMCVCVCACVSVQLWESSERDGFYFVRALLISVLSSAQPTCSIWTHQIFFQDATEGNNLFFSFFLS